MGLFPLSGGPAEICALSLLFSVRILQSHHCLLNYDLMQLWFTCYVRFPILPFQAEETAGNHAHVLPLRVRVHHMNSGTTKSVAHI